MGARSGWGKRTYSRTSTILAGGARGVKPRLPKGLKAGKHVLEVSFMPVGAPKAVVVKLGIKLTGAKKARKASVARIAKAGIRIDRSTLPKPKLPDGRHP